MNKTKLSRIESLKATIARLKEENLNIKKLLAERLTAEYLEQEKQALRFAMEHITIKTTPSKLEPDERHEHLLRHTIFHPIIFWDNEVIS